MLSGCLVSGNEGYLGRSISRVYRSHRYCLSLLGSESRSLRTRRQDIASRTWPVLAGGIVVDVVNERPSANQVSCRTASVCSERIAPNISLTGWRAPRMITSCVERLYRNYRRNNGLCDRCWVSSFIALLHKFRDDDREEDVYGINGVMILWCINENNKPECIH